MSAPHDDSHPEPLDGYPPILGLSHIMEFFNLVNERAAQNFINRHGIPHTRLGRVYSVILEDLIEWLRDRTEIGVEPDLVDEMFDEIVGDGDEEEGDR